MKLKRIIGLAASVAVLGIVGFAGYVQYDLHRSYETPEGPALSDAELAAKVKRGQYVATLSDCVACHTAPGGAPFAGGYEMATPFGTILASNITQDKETGIGTWTKGRFDAAVRHGKGRSGYLYPAMPYPAYVKISNDDLDDLWAYMKTIAPVKKEVVENQLPFPFSMRWILAGWNILFFHGEPTDSQNSKSPELARGQYLVNGPGHCVTCHTPKNPFGADTSDYLQGSNLGAWYASDLSNNSHTGLGSWSVDDLTTYLRRGSNRVAVASGPMVEAIENSTQHMTDADLTAIATYLKSLKATPSAKPAAVASSDSHFSTGKRIYEANCIACHVSNGQGVRDMIPALAGNPQLQAGDTASMLNVLLGGAPGANTHANPTAAGMPRFDWKLKDEQIADLLTYIRNDWGNAAPAVTVETVAKARKATGAAEYLGRP
jgi:mono/diheme cytochrome c family protein